MQIEIPLVIAAFLVGGLVGVTGVGGGAIMTPVLILLFGFSPVVAIATDLVFATLIKLAASVIHSSSGRVDWSVAKKIWWGSIPGVIMGVAVLVYLATEFIFLVNVFLAALLVVTAISMLISIGLSRSTNNRLPIIGGGFIGFAVATTSVGAGAMGMALLRSLIGDKDPKKLVATDIVHAIPIALIAGVSYFFAGFFDFGLLLSLLIGGLPGVAIGALALARTNPVALRKVLAVVLFFAALGILANAFELV